MADSLPAGSSPAAELPSRPWVLIHSLVKPGHERRVQRWLQAIIVMVLGMIALGGITRLTGSGLSMVEWRPLFGTLPPLSEAEWLRVFAQYQASPQYLKVNQWMDLAAFKQIFFWEYFHRLWGRLIGLVVMLPLIVFTLLGWLRSKMVLRALLLIALGGAQGLVGWIMVQSGLVDQPIVAPLKLAAHLLLAMLVLSVTQWFMHDLTPRRDLWRTYSAPSTTLWATLAALIAMIFYGALVAGERAGFIYNTWPLMGDTWIADSVGNLPGVRDVIINPATVQFIHRWLAFVVLAMVALSLWRCQRIVDGILHVRLKFLLALTILQILLGIATLLAAVPVWLGVTHQVNGALLLMALVAVLHRARLINVD
ncbi:COX15/CtaA family protein [Gammaproteobacteria bacterium]|nr:COX15/CtaA family protein [Gammaproteobacteria bacterium]